MGSSKLNIKPLRAHDVDKTIVVMEYYRDEANLPDGEYDSDAMAETIREFVIDPNHCWFNAYEGDRVVGLVAGFLMPIPWSRKVMAHVQFLYMLPSHRNLINGKQLVAHFEEWSKNLGAVKISAGDIGIATERTRAFYQQAGYADTGCWLSKELSE